MDINKIPFVSRNNSVLQAMYWIFNMIEQSEHNLYDIAVKDESFLITNKLSSVTKIQLMI